MTTRTAGPRGRRLRRSPDRLHLPGALRRRLQRRRLRAGAAGQRRGHGLRARALPARQRRRSVMSTVTVYKPHPDPWHAFREDDPLGDVDAARPRCRTRSRRSPRRRWRATARARSTCRSRSPGWGRPTATRAGCRCGTSRRSRPVEPVNDPLGPDAVQPDPRRRHRRVSSNRCSMRRACPPTIVNWCGDEPVSVQEWSAYFGELLGVTAEVDGRRRFRGRRSGRSVTHTKRASITGPGAGSTGATDSGGRPRSSTRTVSARGGEGRA